MLDLENFDIKAFLDRSIAKLTNVLQSNGKKFHTWEPYGNYNKTQLKKENDYVLIIPNHSMFQEPYKNLISNGAKVVLFSGKEFMKSFQDKFPSDRYINYSEHCDYFQLKNFIGKIKPDITYLEHGDINRFLYTLRIKDSQIL